MASTQGERRGSPVSDINHLIDRLERLLNESWRMPLSAYLVINEDDFLEVIDQMRTAIPQEIKEGEKVQRERDRIVAQAEEEAERIVQLAQLDAARLVEEHELIRIAEQRADTILERAQREALVLKEDADEYARQVLVSLNDQLDVVDQQIAALLTTVRNGLETLSHAQEPDQAE
jgi:cell division septum initiation protein DivIVA